MLIGMAVVLWASTLMEIHFQLVCCCASLSTPHEHSRQPDMAATKNQDTVCIDLYILDWKVLPDQLAAKESFVRSHKFLPNHERRFERNPPCFPNGRGFRFLFSQDKERSCHVHAYVTSRNVGRSLSQGSWLATGDTLV